MLTAISRYGARVLPDTAADRSPRCTARGEFVRGPQIAALRARVRSACGTRHARSRPPSAGSRSTTCSKALDLPAGSEIILPSLTFWVVPELARAAGLTVVFADVDPQTFNLDPDSVERSITAADASDRADPPVRPAVRHGRDHSRSRHATTSSCIEDCAHALGRDIQGTAGRNLRRRRLLQLPDAEAAELLRRRHGAHPRQSTSGEGPPARERVAVAAEKRVATRLAVGRLQRIFIRPRVFSFSLFPILWVSSFTGTHPDVFLWEKIRALNPLPDSYLERFPNVQAAIGLEALRRLDGWTSEAQENARYMSRALGSLPGVRVPHVPTGPHTRLLPGTASTVREDGAGTTWWMAASGAASTSRRCTSTCHRISSCFREHALKQSERAAPRGRYRFLFMRA